ncbi:hypothetical protein A359_06840 [secondary endosymbiont of Ctenarytaina eucalypti]|uniref:Uncharacterized protein n=1 Tax=secondary endosymbiont of Ctenarytaina eucalypti TaxID=1199245 RepID=J3Z460_9ENTR|nr:hypothetical protein A359_06840 [secondary endosymbiont of Ctenarytaina eucalypti]
MYVFFQAGIITLARVLHTIFRKRPTEKLHFFLTSDRAHAIIVFFIIIQHKAYYTLCAAHLLDRTYVLSYFLYNILPTLLFFFVTIRKWESKLF